LTIYALRIWVAFTGFRPPTSHTLTTLRGASSPDRCTQDVIRS